MLFHPYIENTYVFPVVRLNLVMTEEVPIALVLKMFLNISL